jgi:hypothetical protein
MPVKKTDFEILNILWEKNQEDFKKFFASKQSNPLTHSHLEKWFLSVDGQQFYKFPKHMSLPLPRLGVLKGFYTWLSSGISGTEFEKVIDSMDKILSDGIGQTGTAAKLGVLIEHLKERMKMVFHSELLINIIAVQAIREDENPTQYNNQIHLEKVNQMKELIEKDGAYPFFHQSQLITPIDFTKLTQIELTTLYHESKAMEASLNPILDLFHQEKKSSNGIMTLQNS